MKKIIVVLFVMLFLLSACADSSEVAVPQQIGIPNLEVSNQGNSEKDDTYILFHKEFGELYQFHVYVQGREICSSTDSFSDPRQWSDKSQPFYISWSNCSGLPEGTVISWDIENAYADGWEIFFQVGEGDLFPAT